jgi:hypothetical protein
VNMKSNFQNQNFSFWVMHEREVKLTNFEYCYHMCRFLLKRYFDNSSTFGLINGISKFYRQCPCLK